MRYTESKTISKEKNEQPGSKGYLSGKEYQQMLRKRSMGHSFDQAPQEAIKEMVGCNVYYSKKIPTQRKSERFSR